MSFDVAEGFVILAQRRYKGNRPTRLAARAAGGQLTVDLEPDRGGSIAAR